MRRTWLLSLLIMAALLAGCQPSEPQPAPSTTPSATATPNPAALKYSNAIVVDCDKLAVRIYNLTSQGAKEAKSLPGITFSSLESRPPDRCYAEVDVSGRALYFLGPVPGKPTKWLPVDLDSGYSTLPGKRGSPGITIVQATSDGYTFPNDGKYVTGLPEGLK